jgi:hypothetical protein
MGCPTEKILFLIADAPARTRYFLDSREIFEVAWVGTPTNDVTPGAQAPRHDD